MQIETKYNIGDRVSFKPSENEVSTGRITGITVRQDSKSSYDFTYEVDGKIVTEDHYRGTYEAKICKGESELTLIQ